MPEDPFGIVYLRGRNSVFHRIDPISKIAISVLIVYLAIFTIREIMHVAVLLIVTLIMLALCKPKFREFIRPLRLLMVILVPFSIAVTLSFAAQGPLMGFGPEDVAYLNLGPLVVPYSKIGLRYATSIFLRATAVCLSALIVTWTTHPRDLVYTLTRNFKLNYKIAWTIFLTLVYAPLIAYESTMISYAQKVRGLKYTKWNIAAVLRNFLLPLMLRGSKKALTTSIALEVRGFGAYPDRTFRYLPPPSKYTKIVIAICVAIAIIYSIYYPPSLTILAPTTV